MWVQTTTRSSLWSFLLSPNYQHSLSALVLQHPLTYIHCAEGFKTILYTSFSFCLSRSDIKKRARVQNTICRYQMSCYLWVQEELEGRPCDPWLASAQTTHPTRNNGRDCPAPLSAREVMQTPLQRRLLWTFARHFSLSGSRFPNSRFCLFAQPNQHVFGTQCTALPPHYYSGWKAILCKSTRIIGINKQPFAKQPALAELIHKPARHTFASCIFSDSPRAAQWGCIILSNKFEN